VTETTVAWLSFEPLDTLMVRDGRGSDFGVSSILPSTVLLPSTTGGAVAAAVAGSDTGCLLGPVLAPRGRPVYPVPYDVVRTEDGTIGRLDPQEVSDDEHTDLGGTPTHLLRGEGDPLGGYCDTTSMTGWLANGDRIRPTASPWAVEPRIGLALRGAGDGPGTAEDGMLYASAHLRPIDGLRIMVGCLRDSPLELVRDTVQLGGRGRLAAVSQAPDLEFPDRPTSFPGGRVTVYLATPALLDNVCWHPVGAALCAVATAGPQPVATVTKPGRGQRRMAWDARHLQWAVPAGSVYYLDFGDAATAADWAAVHHGRLLPGQIDRLLPGQRQGPPLAAAGFGLCFVGRW
jgi:CRISPR-associated protein Cmr3